MLHQLLDHGCLPGLDRDAKGVAILAVDVAPLKHDPDHAIKLIRVQTGVVRFTVLISPISIVHPLTCLRIPDVAL